MLKLVKFDCGCIGTPPVEGQSHVVDQCDPNKYDTFDDGFGFSSEPRDQSDKTFVPLSEAEVGKVLQRLGKQAADAYRYRMIKAALKED